MLINYFGRIVDQHKVLSLISEILTIANLEDASSRILTCTEPDFWLC